MTQFMSQSNRGWSAFKYWSEQQYMRTLDANDTNESVWVKRIRKTLDANERLEET